MNDEQVAWARNQPWFRSERNVAAYRGGIWWEVTAYDAERESEVQFDSFKALKAWSEK